MILLYIVTSYVLMLVWMINFSLKHICDDDKGDIKWSFKVWLFSPVTLPVAAAYALYEW